MNGSSLTIFFASREGACNRLDLVSTQHAIPAKHPCDFARSLSRPPDAVVRGARAHAVYRAALDHFAGRPIHGVQGAHASVAVRGAALTSHQYNLPEYVLRHNLRV